jgi:hypothetical protein
MTLEGWLFPGGTNCGDIESIRRGPHRHAHLA